MSKKNKYSIVNPSQLSIYFGVPGCGKSTIASALVQKYSKKIGADHVFCNYPVDNSTLIDTDVLGKYSLCAFDERALLVIDEAGLEYNNRDFKSFKRCSLEFFKLHRHYGVEVVIFSQTYNDMDLKIRGCQTKLYICRRSIIPFVVCAIPVHTKIGINELTKELCDEYYTSGLLVRLFETKRYFMPKYWKYFDSFTCPKLPPLPR